MKINKIYIKNIHSLKGEHVIDFDLPPLKACGLFAITGPTGAGKSTILDAITLALYNKVPRFDGKVSDKEIGKLGSVITHFCNEGMVELTFTIKGQKYRSTWSIGQTSKGLWKPVTMEIAIFRNNEFEIITNKLSEVVPENERIIGLNYEQFIKSILLSQGEFAQFLKANGNERSELLEKITGSGIYRQLGKAIYERRKSEDEKLQRLQFQLEGVRILSEEEVKAEQEKITEQSKLLEDLSHIIASLESDKQKLSRLQNEMQRQDQLQKNLQLHQQNLTNFATKEIQLELHSKLAPFIKDIHQFQDLQVRIGELTQKQSKLSLDKESTDKSISINESELSGILKQEVTVHNFKPYMQAFEDEIRSLLNTNEQLAGRGSEIRKKIETIERRSSDINFKQLLQIKSPEILAAKLEEYGTKFEDKKDLDIEKIGAEINKLAEKSAGISLQLNEAKSHLDALIQKARYKEQLVLLQSERAAAGEKLKAASDELEVLKQQLEDKHKEHHLALINSKIEEFRPSLVEGEPCPLCHQTVGHLPEIHQVYEVARIGAALNQIKLIIDEKIKVVTAMEKQTSALEAKTATVTSLIKDVKLSTQLSDDQNIIRQSIMNLEATLQTYASQKARLEEDQKLAISKSFFDAVMPEANDLLQVTEAYKANRAKLDQMKWPGFEGKEHDMIAATNEIQDRVARLLQQKSNQETEIKIVTEELTKRSEEKDRIEPSLLNALSNLGLPTIDEASSKILKNDVYESLRKEKEQLLQQIAVTESGLAESRKTLLEIREGGLPEKSADDIEVELKSNQANKNTLLQELGGIREKLRANEENIKSKSSLIAEIDRQSGSMRKWTLLNNHIGDAQGNKFSKFAQHLTLMQLTDNANIRLSELTERYKINPPVPDGDIEIIDTFQGDTIRSAKTLSGGETFLVSLAFALGLSDLASSNNALESLFIDEGISTLDSDSLELAIETLEKLQSENNKTIGIISHIDSLKERIATQIKKKKKGSGYSHIEVVAV